MNFKLITDYSQLPQADCSEEEFEDLQKLTGPLEDLIGKTPGLLVWPEGKGLNPSLNREDHFILKYRDYKTLCSGDLLGFVGSGNTLLEIRSRFAKEGREDFFLHYMLSKVLDLQLFDLKFVLNESSVFDFRLLLFPNMLNKAVSLGIFRRYTKHQCNNSAVRGVTDIKPHIKLNIPFEGKVAYSVRDLSYDNPVTQLIRHTIEFIASTSFVWILSTDSITKEAVRRIRECTPSYNPHDRLKIMHLNRIPTANPYFVAYRPLQKLCLQILRYDRLTYGQGKERIWGLLISGSRLWEMFLNKELLPGLGFIYADNACRTNPIDLMKNSKSYPRYPDFRHTPDDKSRAVIIDAKYKNQQGDSIERNDVHQIITYMHAFSANTAALIYPSAEENAYCKKPLELAGMGGTIYTLKYKIPQHASNFEDFSEQMKQESCALREIIKGKLLPKLQC